MGIFPVPFSELFQIHGSKSQLHPVSNLDQACISGITQTVFLFCIRKNALNGFFPRLVHPLVDRSVPGIVSHILVFLPDMTGNCHNTIFVCCTKMSGRAIATDLWIAFVFPVSIPIGCAVVQHLVFRTDNAVEMLVIHILPPFMSAFHGLRTFVGCG